VSVPSVIVWKRAGRDITLVHCPDHEAIGLWYARIYTARAGFQYSDSNQLIFNLKKDPKAKEAELVHKRKAIQQFASELTVLLGGRTDGPPFYLIPIPSSKTPSHSEFDNRLDEVARLVCDAVPRAKYCPILVRRSDISQAHKAEAERDPEVTYASVEVDLSLYSGQIESKSLVLVDDVLTTGATFTGCRRRVLEAIPGSKVSGIFWAKAEYAPSET
jgi:predicted amidophosphoribosyltransferase